MLLIRTIDYILAPTRHLENFIIIVPFVFTRGTFYVVNSTLEVSQRAQWLADFHSLSMIYGSNPEDHILFFNDNDYSSLKKIFHRDSSSSCQKS
jgi:hypothetical protein